MQGNVVGSAPERSNEKNFPKIENSAQGDGEPIIPVIADETAVGASPAEGEKGKIGINKRYRAGATTRGETLHPPVVSVTDTAQMLQVVEFFRSHKPSLELEFVLMCDKKLNVLIVGAPRRTKLPQ